MKLLGYLADRHPTFLSPIVALRVKKKLASTHSLSTPIRQTWKHRIQQGSLSKIRPATKQHLHVEGTILSDVRLVHLCVRIWFGLIFNLATKMLLGTSIIDRFISSIFPSDRKFVP